MSKYITSVQLRNAADSDYDKLDLEMEKGRFIRVVNQGRTKDAVRGERREYNYRGMTTLQEVISAAYTAASRTGKQYQLTVIREKS